MKEEEKEFFLLLLVVVAVVVGVVAVVVVVDDGGGGDLLIRVRSACSRTNRQSSDIQGTSSRSLSDTPRLARHTGILLGRCR